MAERITKIQIGADVRDIGLGVEAAWELGSSVMEQIAGMAYGLALNGTRLDVKTGYGLRVTVASGVMLDTQWLFGTMKAHPGEYTDPENLIKVLAPKMGTFAGPGLSYGGQTFEVSLGSGLEFDDGKICVNLGYGVEYSADGSLNINLGSGLMFDTDGSGRIKLDVFPGRGIAMNPIDFTFALDTLVAGAMLTKEGNGTVVCLGSGLEVAMGTCLTEGAKGVSVDVDAILDELDAVDRKERLATMLLPYLNR